MFWKLWDIVVDETTSTIKTWTKITDAVLDTELDEIV